MDLVLAQTALGSAHRVELPQDLDARDAQAGRAWTDSLGRPSLVTQYDAASSGNATDEVSYTYDGWGDITSYKQDKDSAVGGSGYYEVAYAYAKATTGRNTIRRSQMTLPGGKVVDILYNIDKDSSCSRVSRLSSSSVILVSYAYLGAGRVVRTIYPQPDIASRAFDPGTGDYDGYLDRFNRVVRNVWNATTPTFYDVDISYDRNSNITWVEDNVHAGFDVKYAMDDLDRLIDAEEGTRSGGSITSRKRHQTWTTLDHVGNWDRSKLDLDGDDNWNETNEYDDTRTNNKVNELETRDTDSNASVNYTLAYDAAGNLTDDAESYEYVYDAFYRLRKVKNQGALKTLAEYRYNGFGHMIAVLEDTDADGDADGSDITFYPAYDERWREVARFRAGDTSPKEQFVNATAGLDGYGASSYINDVVCRERDNTSPGWLAASDGTLEERYYYCPNWRGDTSALVHYLRYLAEWVKYSPYGIPFGLPGADTNSDGDNDAADATQIQTWIDAPAYDVRGDVDLDGDVDSTDKAAAQSVPITGNTLGWKSLSDDAFRNRSAGEGDQQRSPLDHSHARHRERQSSTGLWLQRDPLDYVDGMNLYALARLSPLVFRDPNGTVSTANFPTLAALGALHVIVVHMGCCWLGWDGSSAGQQVCCNGAVVSCNYWNHLLAGSGNYGPTTPGQRSGDRVISDCIDAHEAAHQTGGDSGSCEGKADGENPGWASSYNNPGSGSPSTDSAAREGSLMRSEKDCLDSGSTNECGGNQDCIDRIAGRILQLTRNPLFNYP